MLLRHMIQDTRKAKRLSVETVAEATGLSVGTIRAYEQGRRIPSAEALKAIFDYLEIKGTWVDTTTWKLEDGKVYKLAPFAGGHKREQYEVEPTNEAILRLTVLRKILDADMETLAAIDRLVK